MTLYECLDDPNINEFPNLRSVGGIILNDFSSGTLETLANSLPQKYKRELPNNPLAGLSQFYMHVGAPEFKELCKIAELFDKELLDEAVQKIISNTETFKPPSKAEVKPKTSSIFSSSKSRNESETTYEELIEKSFYHTPSKAKDVLNISVVLGKQLVLNTDLYLSSGKVFNKGNVLTVLNKMQERLVGIVESDIFLVVLNHSTGEYDLNVRSSELQKKLHASRALETKVARLIDFNNYSVMVKKEIDLILLYGKTGIIKDNSGNQINVKVSSQGLVAESNATGRSTRLTNKDFGVNTFKLSTTEFVKMLVQKLS